MVSYKRLILCLLLCVGGGWLSGLVTQQGIEGWYIHLNHPAGTPPNIVFPIVWTFLYTLMAIALYLFWSSQTSNKKMAAFFFALQLILNFSWSWIFFGLRKPELAFVNIIFLWAAIFATILLFKRHTSLGAFLLIPYLVWVSYAVYLNLFIWILN
ncbi:MAG: TspO/MBR family protein [Parachlamydiaceae bacterium]|nr:TspO/MBR family protein [Parachlamydiaceae bacterium]